MKQISELEEKAVHFVINIDYGITILIPTSVVLGRWWLNTLILGKIKKKIVFEPFRPQLDSIQQVLIWS